MQRRFGPFRFSAGVAKRRKPQRRRSNGGGGGVRGANGEQVPVFVITDAQPRPLWRRALSEGLGPAPRSQRPQYPQRGERHRGRGAWRQRTNRAQHVRMVSANTWLDDDDPDLYDGEPDVDQVEAEPVKPQSRKATAAADRSIWHRNLAQLAPVLVALTVAFAPIGWWLPLTVARHFGAADLHLAAFVAAVTAISYGRAAHRIATHAGEKARPWLPRLILATVAAVGWVTGTVYTGLDSRMYAALIITTCALSAGWWRRHRTPNPTAPPGTLTPTNPAPAKTVDRFVAAFNAYAKAQGGPAHGNCRLTVEDVNDDRSIYTLTIDRSKDSLKKVLGRHEQFATALGVLPEDLIIERHPVLRESWKLRLTIITRSPVAETVGMTEPRWVDDGHGNSWIELGVYSDGEGVVRLPVITDHTSAETCLIVANKGGGKSTLLLLAAITARSSGRVLLIYLDGKGGSSSPVLVHWADWAPTAVHDHDILTNGRNVLRMLEALLAARRQQALAEGASGITPTPERPLVIVIIDEAHVFMNDGAKLDDDPNRTVAQRWRDVIRQLRAFAIEVWAASQGVKIDSWGGVVGSEIKEYLGGNATIAGRLRTATAGNLLRVPYDLSTLPVGGGHFYIDVRDGRSAPWRAWRVSDRRSGGGAIDSEADAWMARLAARHLEKAALQHMPDVYLNRAEIAAQWTAAVAAGRMPPVPVPTWKRGSPGSLSPSTPIPAPQDSGVGGRQLAFPTLRLMPRRTSIAHEAPDVPDGLAGTHARVWAEIAAGRDTVTAICASLSLGKSRVHEVITDLIAAGHVHRPGGKGRYELRHA